MHDEGSRWASARAASSSPGGAVGEEVALHKGDDVEIVDVREGCLYVKKKRAENGSPSEDFIQLEE